MLTIPAWRQGRCYESAAWAFALLFGLSLWCSGCLIWDNNRDGVIRIAAIGDSNTTDFSGAPSWCERLMAAHPNIDWRCYGRAGTRANSTFAVDLMATALAEAPDVVLISFGTNDIFFDGAEPADVLTALKALAAQAEAGGAVVAAPALVPQILYIGGTGPPRIVALNALIAAWRPTSYLDFFNGFLPEDYALDGVHFTSSGQQKRADAAAAVLWAQ